jgi:hypothetical protein
MLAGTIGVTMLWLLNGWVFGDYNPWALFTPRRGWLAIRFAEPVYFPRVLLTAVLAAIVTAALLGLLRYAMLNHRSAERGAIRVVRQLGVLGMWVMVALTLWSGAFVYYRAPRVEQIEEMRRINLERIRKIIEERNLRPVR